MPLLLFHPPGALGSDKVPPVQISPGDQHVTARAPWVGEVSLLPNDHSIPDMPVEKVYLHCRPCRRASRTTSTGKFRGPTVVGKAIEYIHSSLTGAVAAQLCLPSAALPFCVCMCPTSNPSAISSPHSLYWTCPLFCSRYEGPSPVIYLPYATSNCVPAA